MEYGIQMYSVKDLGLVDFPATFRAVKEAGYTMVETANVYENSAETVRDLILENGLKICGAHSAWTKLLPENIEETIRFQTILGNKNYVIPVSRFETREEMDAVIKAINFAQPILADAGIALHYHNHYKEFDMQAWGGRAFDELVNGTDVKLEIDTYWAFYSGVDPIELVKKHIARVEMIHLRDGDPSVGGAGCALGEGKAPVRDVVALGRELGLTMVVETGGFDPTGPEEVKRCLNYLRSLEA